MYEIQDFFVGHFDVGRWHEVFLLTVSQLSEAHRSQSSNLAELVSQLEAIQEVSDRQSRVIDKLGPSKR